MSDLTQMNDFRTVTLVDRTGEGGTEIIFNGVRVTFPKGEIEKSVPRFLAEWLFSVDQHMVWTTEGEFTRRFGIKDADPSLVEALGPEVTNCDMIEVDKGRQEGWDTTGVDRSNVRIVPINVPASALRERQGSGAISYGDRR